MAQDPPKNQNHDEDVKHRRRDFTVWFIFAALLGLWLIQIGFDLANPTQTIPYSQFLQWVADNKVGAVSIGPDLIEGRLRAPEADEPRRFATVRVDPDLAESLAAQGVAVTGTRPSGAFNAIMSWVLPAFIFYLVWSFLLRRMGQGLSGAFSMGKSPAKLFVEKDVTVSFADVAGVDEAKHELEEVVGFLKDPKRFGRLGAHAPKGVLLVGPPGTGKTLLARAVAGEAGVPFFSISGSEFVEMFVGIGAARVRDLFDQARQAAPSIIFIDELDALGRSRSGIAVGGFDEKEQTLNQLLAEIDGFDTKAGVILLAATNRPEILDKALLRPGRFDRQVLVDRPDRAGRLAILLVHARKISLIKNLDLDAVASMTTGFAGADLANLVNEAAIAATRRDGEAVTLADFETALERIVAGLEKKSRIISAKERRRVAVHEMGHALVAANLPTVDPVQKVSIVPHGLGALGFTMQRPTDERFLLTRSELEERITVLLGGRAAEDLIYAGDVSTGAADDLEQATAIALDMTTRFGMNPTLGERIYVQDRNPFQLGLDSNLTVAGETHREIDVAVRDTIVQAHARAASILNAKCSDLEEGVALLLEKETLKPEAYAPLRKSAGDLGAGPSSSQKTDLPQTP